MPMPHFSRSASRRKAELDDSPDSLFFSSSSSAAAAADRNQHNSNDRFSFGSDHESLFPILVHNLAGRSLDPDQHHRNLLPSPSSSKEEEQAQDPSKLSFSEALKECQDRRSRSEAHSKRQRPASLDFNGHAAGVIDATTISPRFLLGNLNAMKKNSSVATSSSTRSRTGNGNVAMANFPSPGTPGYRYQKGWSSERVPLPTNSSRRYVAGGPLLPFNKGKALPSKWEDAEKWIFSPVGADNAGRYSVPPPHLRRPKSKSGPLGPPAYLSAAVSPLNPCFDSGRVGVGLFHAGSPFLTGVLVADHRSCGGSNNSGGGGNGGSGVSVGRSSSANAEPYIMRSVSVHGWSDTMIESSASLPSSRDEKSDCTREAGTVISPTILRKDVATQMSPDGSPHSSPKERPSLSPSTPSTHPIEELESHFSKLEVRDVQVDDRVTVTRWSKKHIARGSDRRSTNIIEWRKKTVEAKGSSSRWDVAETAKSISKYKREEAKITAWENLQKAKAEASIRKLEVKLEKKRSSSMDRILNKLRSAQKKAQEMRSAVSTIQAQQVTSTSKRSSFRKTRQISSLSGCFTCHAF